MESASLSLLSSSTLNVGIPNPQRFGLMMSQMLFKSLVDQDKTQKDTTKSKVKQKVSTTQALQKNNTSMAMDLLHYNKFCTGSR